MHVGLVDVDVRIPRRLHISDTLFLASTPSQVAARACFRRACQGHPALLEPQFIFSVYLLCPLLCINAAMAALKFVTSV